MLRTYTFRTRFWYYINYLGNYIISIIILVWFTLAGWATQGGPALGRWLGAW